MAAEPIQRQQQNPTTGNDSSQFDDIGTKASDQLFNATQWAKNLPFYQQLSSNDQLALMKLAGKELFILNFVKSHFSTNVTDLIRSNTDGWPQYGGTFCDHVKALQHQMDRLTALEIDPIEHACLKALILFSPGKFLVSLTN